jgi:hypothetical protein
MCFMPDRSDRATHGSIERGPSDEEVSAILAAWRERLRGARNLQPREGLRGRRERALTRALLAAAEQQNQAQGPSEEAIRKLTMVAALYGADQPRDRLDPGALCEELGHLRQAAWEHLRHGNPEHRAVTERILAFDRALTIALRAALTGGFRCEPEQYPQWSERLDAIVSESMKPAPGPPPPPGVSPSPTTQRNGGGKGPH